jgi:hypothetical protein
MPSVCGNPRGRPTNVRLAAKRAATGSYKEKLKRAASYEGITPEQFVRLARIAYGKQWQGPLAGDLRMSVRGVIRWAQGQYKISHAKEMLLLTTCLRRARTAHALVRARYRRAAAPRNPDGVSEPRVAETGGLERRNKHFGFSPAPLRATSSGRILPTCRQGEVGPDSERVSMVFRSELTNENPPNACDCHRDGVSGSLRRVAPPPIAFCLDSLWVKSQN